MALKQERTRDALATAWFALTLFVGAALLFVVQPMTARTLLPVLGGSPAVWNTCLVFFQAALLAGYAYAHLAPAWLGVRRQAVLHVGLLFVLLSMLPWARPEGGTVPDLAHPAAWLLGFVSVVLGLPFLILAATAPLLQGWLATTTHRAARDPYFLYAASNLGSMVGLLGYPFVVERALGLPAQWRAWSVGYVVLAALVAGCAVWLWRLPQAATVRPAARAATDPRLSTHRRVRWLVLAFVPSSLLLSVTAYLTTDIAAIPLLWVVPMALYLLTFILAFARRRHPRPAFLARWTPLAIVMLVLSLLSEATEPATLLVALHLGGLFWIALFCHSELASDRPAATRLTEFYLWIALGGVTGGIFNALLAPVLFVSLLEYPLVLVAVCALRPAPSGPSTVRQRRLDWLLPLGLGTATAALVVTLQWHGTEPGPLSVAGMFAVPVIACYTLLERPRRFALGVAALLLAGSLYDGVHGRATYRARSFFGVHRVTIDPTGAFRVLVHGNTVHGRQSLDPARRATPLAYYYPTGPIGRLFAALHGDPRVRRVGVIGLGAGALAAYADPGQRWTFFELDPAVVAMARASGSFTYLADCRAGEPEIVLGDARVTLTRAVDRFGVLVLDAFGSDAIPVHLLTREALRLFRARLAPDGILAVNVSNRYLDLPPVLGALARDAAPPMVAYLADDAVITANETARGKSPSTWVLLAADERATAAVTRSGGWTPLRARPGDRAWTDDRADVLRALRPWGAR